MSLLKPVVALMLGVVMFLFEPAVQGVDTVKRLTRLLAQGPLPTGEIITRKAAGRYGISYYLYVPANARDEQRPLVAVHGISRNAAQHANAFREMAQASGRVLIAPLFSKDYCPRYQRVVRDRCAADKALLTVLADVQMLTGITTDKVDIFGFSGGSQFAHRFAMLHPERAGGLMLTSAGWYTFPSTNERFPYGIAPRNETGRSVQRNLTQFLQIPMLILVGDRDVNRDSGLRKGKMIDRQQGRNRVQRAARWSQAIRATARTKELVPDVTFQVLPGCGHSFSDCVTQGNLVSRVNAWLQARQ